MHIAYLPVSLPAVSRWLAALLIATAAAVLLGLSLLALAGSDAPVPLLTQVADHGDPFRWSS
jgi:hypothetical protein